MRSDLLKSYQLWCLNLALKNCRIIWLLHNVHRMWSFWNSPIICRPNFVIDDALSAYQSLLFHIFSLWKTIFVNVIMILIERFSETSFHNLRKIPLFSLPWFSQKKGHSEFVQLVEYIIIILVRCSAFTWRLLSKRQILAYVVKKTRAGQ